MRALISGQAGVAVLCDAGPRFAVAFDSPGETLPCSTWADVRALLAGADDVLDLPETTHEAAVEELDLAWAKDRAMQLTLALLDGDTRAITRAEAAESVGELFAEPISGRPGEVEAFVLNRLSSAPMPLGESDLPGAILIAASADRTGAVVSLLRAVESLQPRMAGTQNKPEAMAICQVLQFDGEDAEVSVLMPEGYELPSVIFPAWALRAKELSEGSRFIWTMRDSRSISPADIDTETAQAPPKLSDAEQAELESLYEDSRKREAEGEDWTEDTGPGQ